jgi:phosphatidylglycerol:prolipoprotein diacylglycerol transferase
VQPEIHILGITLQSFGLMLALAFIVCGVATGRFLQEIGRPVDWAYEAVFAALVGGVVGSRLWWIGENWSQAKDDLLGSLFSGSGLVFYGGLIGGAICVLLWAWWRGVFDLLTLDSAAVPLAAGYAIGRIGCQLAGDGDYGKDWDGPWAMAYPNGTVPTTTPVHPTPVYELLAMGAFAYLLWRWRDRWQPGTLMAVYLIGAGLERFLVEFVRRNADTALGLTQPQLVAIASIVAGGAWLALQRTTSMRRRARHRESALSRGV